MQLVFGKLIQVLMTKFYDGRGNMVKKKKTTISATATATITTTTAAPTKTTTKYILCIS